MTILAGIFIVLLLVTVGSALRRLRSELSDIHLMRGQVGDSEAPVILDIPDGVALSAHHHHDCGQHGIDAGGHDCGTFDGGHGDFGGHH